MRALPLFLCLTLAACADLPDVQSTISPASLTAAPPELVPLGPLLQGLTPQADAQEIDDLDTRADRLRARAARLRQQQI